MSPPPPAEVIEAAESLKYRDFLTVVLIVDQPETFPDNWIYIHEPEVRLGRIQNFKNWSPDLVPDPTKTSLGLEYFCFEGDDLWTMSDADLIALGRREIDAIGLVPAAEVDRRLRRPDAQGVPGLRRRLPGPPGRDPRLAQAARQPRAGRAQRHAQVQQSGSLDDDRRSWPRGTSWAWASSTPGRSTPTPNITRRRPRTNSRTKGERAASGQRGLRFALGGRLQATGHPTD